MNDLSDISFSDKQIFYNIFHSFLLEYVQYATPITYNEKGCTFSLYTVKNFTPCQLKEKFVEYFKNLVKDNLQVKQMDFRSPQYIYLDQDPVIENNVLLYNGKCLLENMKNYVDISKIMQMINSLQVNKRSRSLKCIFEA